MLSVPALRGLTTPHSLAHWHSLSTAPSGSASCWAESRADFIPTQLSQADVLQTQQPAHSWHGSSLGKMWHGEEQQFPHGGKEQAERHSKMGGGRNGAAIRLSWAQRMSG